METTILYWGDAGIMEGIINVLNSTIWVVKLKVQLVWMRNAHHLAFRGCMHST